MKKSFLYTGFAYFAVGVLFLLLAIGGIEERLNALFCGFAGAGIFPGLQMMYRYFYWNRPENRQRYAEKVEMEKIESHDERNVILRGRAAQYTLVWILCILAISIVLLSILGKLEMIAFAKPLILYLSVLLLLIFVLFQVVYQKLKQS